MLTARPLLPWPQQFPELSPAVGKPGGVVAGTRAQQHSEPAAEQWVQKRNMKKNKNVIPAFSPCTMEFVLKAFGSKLQLGKTHRTQLLTEFLYEVFCRVWGLLGVPLAMHTSYRDPLKSTLWAGSGQRSRRTCWAKGHPCASSRAPAAACSPKTEGLCKGPPAQWGAQVKYPDTFLQMANTPSRVHGPRHCAAPCFSTEKSIFPFYLLDSSGDRKPLPSTTGCGNERHSNAPD